MSVEKVNAYREKNPHRKENLEKEKNRKKRNRLLSNGILCLCVVAILAAIGMTGYNQYKSYQASLPDYNVTSQVISDFAGVTETEAETEEAEEADAAEAEEAGSAAETDAQAEGETEAAE